MTDLLAHRPPMVLLDAIVQHSAFRTVCVTTVGGNSLFRDSGGQVPAWVGLEYMAQCIAAHAGLRARADGKPPPLGFLIGSRRVAFHVAGFAPGQALIVAANHLWGETGLGAFACSVEDGGTGTLLVEGAINVFVPTKPGSLTERMAE